MSYELYFPLSPKVPAKIEVTSLLSSGIIILSLGLIFVLLICDRIVRVTKTLLFSDY
jgi:hypothetical protein